MKILFDQNISFRILRNLIEVWPEAKQVRALGLEDKTDRKM
jgi:predicted nuclease of predicted toxin-antitoxin system